MKRGPTERFPIVIQVGISRLMADALNMLEDNSNLKRNDFVRDAITEYFARRGINVTSSAAQVSAPARANGADVEERV